MLQQSPRLSFSLYVHYYDTFSLDSFSLVRNTVLFFYLSTDETSYLTIRPRVDRQAFTVFKFHRNVLLLSVPEHPAP
jgi:hypothetical protein